MITLGLENTVCWRLMHLKCWRRRSKKMVRMILQELTSMTVCMCIGELIMSMLQEARVIQLNKMIGLPPTAKPSSEDVRMRSDQCFTMYMGLESSIIQIF